MARREAFTARRKACGYTQEELAQVLGVDPSTIRRWESGANEPQPCYRPRIGKALQVTLSELDVLLAQGDRTTSTTAVSELPSQGEAISDDLGLLAQGDPSNHCGHVAHIAGIPMSEGMVLSMYRRQFIGAGVIAGTALASPQAAATGRKVGRSDAAHFRQRVSDLRRLDDFSGGDSVFPLAMAEIGKLSSLASNGSFSQEVGRDLLSTLAELYQFTSWTAFDAGRQEAARRLALAAANAANQASSRVLGATALSELSYLTASSETPQEGVDMARASLANAPTDVLPVVRVLLADRLAWACARTGDAQGVDRALGISEDAHNQREKAAHEEPDTVYWINRDESGIMAGRCWAELRQPNRAVTILEALTIPYDETHAREVALYSCWLAGSYLDAGDIDGAVDSGSRAIELSLNTASPRTDNLLRTMLNNFHAYKDVPEVRDLLASWPL